MALDQNLQGHKDIGMHLKHTPFTLDVWPPIGPYMLRPVSADHIQTFLSSLPEATILLSAEKLRA